MRAVSRFTRIAAAGVAIASLAVTEVVFLQAAEPPKDIVDTAVAARRFTTLAAALQAAGLVETLSMLEVLGAVDVTVGGARAHLLARGDLVTLDLDHPRRFMSAAGFGG